MIEWYFGMLAAIIACALGGVLHAIVPPQDTDKKTIGLKIGAGAIVGIMLFLGGSDPRVYAIPSPGVLLWFGMMLTTGYTALEVLQNLLFKPAPVTPATK